MIAPEFYKSISAYFNGITVYSDNGILFDSTQEYKTFKYEKNNYDMKDINDDKSLVEFIIISSSNEEKYFRSYIKIQNVFATVGGIMNGLLIFGSIVFTFFEGKQYRIDLIDSLFSFVYNQGFSKNYESCGKIQSNK